jgi:hypothetical protein
VLLVDADTYGGAVAQGHHPQNPYVAWL